MRPVRLLPLIALCFAQVSLAGDASPTCLAAANETLVSWPASDPVWEFCTVPPGLSSGPQGSGLELRQVYLHGRLVLKRAHAPMLFAEYQTSTCYRDWKDEDSQLIQWTAPNPTFLRRTTSSCDRSTHATEAYGTCPFGLDTSGMPTGQCVTGVVVDDHGAYVEVSTQYSAGWYLYSSRFRLYANGGFEPEFGFGNSNGTFNNTTHWHHNYWRLDFDIEGAANDTIRQDNVVQTTEFTALRCIGQPGCAQERQWQVVDTVTGRGFALDPADADYATPTNQSGRNFHQVDVIGALYVNNEFGDSSNNNIGDCRMAHENLANGGDLDGVAGAGTDVVLYYRGGVRDLTAGNPEPQNSMICKKVGPMFRPIGVWAPVLFGDDFE